VKKFRLRLLFQEIDLTEGNFVIGRASACNLTIEDPLVSREHARIMVYPDRAELHDMGSRNGTQLNGKPVKGGERLRHGDRLRIGSYEFIFVVDLPNLSPMHPQTMRSFRCPECQTAFSDDAESCPECGAPVIREKNRQLGRAGEETAPIDLEDSFVRQKAQMLDEVLNMAISMGHWDKAAGFLDSRIKAFDKSVARGRVNREMLVAISEASLTVARGLREGNRIDWVIQTWTSHRLGMPTSLVAALDEASYGWFDLEPGLTRYLADLEICEANEECRLALLTRLRGKPSQNP
jgi:hypothetical protein